MVTLRKPEARRSTSAGRTSVIESVLAAVVASVLFGLLLCVKLSALDGMQGDTAIFFQIAENIAQRGEPVSEVFANTQAFIDSPLLVAPPRVFAADPLAPPAQTERNVMRFHADAILYPIGLLVRFLPTAPTVFALDVGAFVGLLLCVYACLRGGAVAPPAAIAFCLLLVSHPAWYASIVLGQFYPDRLFVFAGFALAWAAARRDPNPAALVALAALCALINERGAVTSGIFLIAYAGLYAKDGLRPRLLRAATGGALLLYGLVMVKLVLVNAYYGGFLPGNLATVVAEFHDPVFAHKALVFGLVNAPLVLLALFEWRAALIALVLMAPNLIGNVGGAEKTGWSTAYHSYYFPMLVWAAAAGFTSAYRRFGRSPAGARALTGAVLALALVEGCVDPNAGGAIADPKNLASSALPLIANAVQTAFGPHTAVLAAASDALRAAVPAGATVTTTEPAMTPLYRGRSIRIFPIGIDTADYAVMQIESQTPAGAYTWGGIVNFLGPDQVALANALIVARMKRDGYDFDHPTVVPALGVGVIRRIHRD